MLSLVRCNNRPSIFLAIGFTALLLIVFPPDGTAAVRNRFTNQESLLGSPTFEEDRPPDGIARYSWRTSAYSASFQAGGAVLFTSAKGASARLTFPGGAAGSQPLGESPTALKSRYYIGAAQDWRSSSHFESIRYSQIYPGIDLVFIISEGRLEYNFEIAPRADPAVIRIRYEDAKLRLDGAGNLRVEFAHAGLVQRRPQASQTVGENVRTIACAYRMSRSGDVAFETAAYNRSIALTIDPVLIFSTFLGGSSADAIYGAATDAEGNLYFVGETASGSVTNGSVAAAPAEMFSSQR